jgi:hypothetical protein
VTYTVRRSDAARGSRFRSAVLCRRKEKPRTHKSELRYKLATARAFIQRVDFRGADVAQDKRFVLGREAAPIICRAAEVAESCYRENEALHRRIRSRLLKTFARPGDQSERHAVHLASRIWVSQREWRRRESIRTKLECALKSGAGDNETHETHKDCDE